MSHKHDSQYMRIAKILSENSHAQKKVGAIIVKDLAIISDGYNGTPSGFDNKCEDQNGKTLPYVLHAESNAILKLAKSNHSSDGATIYTLMFPCLECAKMIIQAGIKRVVYENIYRKTDGLNLLRMAKVQILHLKNS